MIKYIIIGLCIFAVIVIVVMSLRKLTKKKSAMIATSEMNMNPIPDDEIMQDEQGKQEFVIPVETIIAESFADNDKLVEITDSKVLAHVTNLIPELFQVGNATNNALNAAHETGEVLYRAIIPAGAKLSDSKSMKGALRGIYHGVDGIKGHADLMPVEVQNGATVVANTVSAAMGVASMVVGQYYMTQINFELGAISDDISKISEFQDNEYKSRVLSLVAHVKKITDFEIEIIENEELRLSKITHLDNLEEECTKLLGQANLTLAGFAKKTDINYDEYEKELENAQTWFEYQKSLLDVLCKISELKYTLHLGSVSREQCVAILLTYTNQADEAQKKLTSWHDSIILQLNIDTDENRRKRKGFDKVIHSLPSMFNENYKFRAIEEHTSQMIIDQKSGHIASHHQDTTNLYDEDVQLIAKAGKIYYLPESITE